VPGDPVRAVFILEGEMSQVDLLRVERSIHLVRGDKVILDEDLAELYGVEVKRLNEQVKRNLDRFPADFMFQLTNQEFTNLKSQSATSSQWGGRRTPPYAFSEQGVAMLSSVLHSPQAVQVNIEIMRTFVRLRRMLASHAELAERLEQLEQKYDTQFRAVFDAIRQLMADPSSKNKQIGFKVKESVERYS
jgi:ORF6N domain